MQALLDRGDRVVYIGSKSGLEERLVSDLEVEYLGITTGKLRRYLSFENLLDAFRVPVGILQAFRHVARVRPSAVFSKGGYVAFPLWLLVGYCAFPWSRTNPTSRRDWQHAYVHPSSSLNVLISNKPILGRNTLW